MSALTEAQHQAVTAAGNVLVVAGAGTGKTRTLVERALRLVTKQGASLDRMLLVTFTEAAAAEMRQRIRDQLLAALRSEPDQPHLAQQVALLDSALICTLHSFCLRLVSEHAVELGIDPEVTVLEPTQTQPLITQALDTVLARHFEPSAPLGEAVRELIRRYGRGSEERIRNWLVHLHRYSQAQPNPDAWWQGQMDYFKSPDPSRWRQWLVEGFEEWRRVWVEFLQSQPQENTSAHRCKEILSRGIDPSRGTGSERLESIAAVLDAVEAVDQAEAWPRGTKTKLRAPMAGLFEEVAFWQSLLDQADGIDPLQQDWDWVREPMLTLLQLAREFSEAFTQAKREWGGVDFADLEQLALRLLVDAQTGQPTRLARLWQQRLDHIFVDEYQDINPAQDAILTALSRSGAESNRFLVGDLKQSIYRFRLANPRIIGRYQTEWQPGSSTGCCVALTENFRSREALLDFVNELFGALMRPGLGGTGYGPEAALRFGDPAGRQPLARRDAAGTGAEPCVELHLLLRPEELDEAQEQDPDSAPQAVFDLTGTEREARLVARRLRQLRQEGYRVWDPALGEFRPVRWSDMAVLLRAPADKVEAYAQEFHRAGVPLQAARGGFLEAQEVMDLHSLLQVLDNPLQDVPLVAVLRSPLVGMSLDELVCVRTHQPHGCFWTALKQFHHKPPPATASASSQAQASAWEKVDWFLRRFEAWREQVRLTSLSHCLETVLDETHYEALLHLDPRGAERVANVRRFVDLARRYDPYQRQGLFRFLSFLAAQQEVEQDIEPASPPRTDSVTLTSIHKSKGLEFPVVVVADLGKRFNLAALRSDLLLSEDYGLSPMVCPPDDRPRYPSLPCWLARGRERRELLSEELRLLYVACTRARDRLILTGQASARANPTPWPQAAPAQIPEAELLKAQSYLDWVRAWLGRAIRPTDRQSSTHGQTHLLRWRLWRETDPELACEVQPASASDAGMPEPVSHQAAEHLAQRLAWRYPFEPATRTRAKASVTELRRWTVEPDEESDRWFSGPTLETDTATQPAGPVARGLTLSPEQRGIAHHRFQQFVRLERTGSLDALQQEAQRIREAGLLTQAEVEALDLPALARFWDSALGRRIRANPAAVRRELEFTAGLSPADLAQLGVPVESGLAADELIVVQGVVDLTVFEAGNLWLVDFKTDAVTPATLVSKLHTYRIQLALYSLALERIHHRPVTERWLHFLALGKSVQV